MIPAGFIGIFIFLEKKKIRVVGKECRVVGK